MSAIERHGSGSEWEEQVGYSRVVRAGPLAVVAGTTAAGPGDAVRGGEDPYEQTRAAIERIAEALEGCGLGLADVIQTRIYVTDIDHWPEVARAHREAFAAAPPAAAMVEVSRLIDPRLLVEIEAVAWAAR